MARRIPENIIEEIKAKSDIVDIVSSYVSLTKKTGQNMFGLCPFHHEKTPSFSVSVLKQMYYCFGCHKGGDVIHFIMDIEHMSYPEAIRFLGDRCGVHVPEDHEGDERWQEEKEKRDRLYALNTEAARYFYQSLQGAEAAPARKYMQKRGISRSMAISFGLGYAPDRWQGLLDHLSAKGYSLAEAEASGLFKKNRKGGLYDLFRGRLIFPIIDVMGRIVAFGGRVLDDSLPKYLNSPETAVYTKGRHLYGLNIAKKTREKRLLLVEGYMDCLSLHQAGIDHAVASLGTALTEQQAALLRKYREEIVLGYDMDRAGRMAVIRNIDVLRDKGAKPFVLQLPEAKDPDEYIRSHSADEFRFLLSESVNGLDYKFIYAKQQATKDGKLNKIRYQETAADLLLDIKNPVLRALYLPRVAEDLEVPRETIEMLLEMKQKDKKADKGRRRLPKPQRENAVRKSSAGEKKSAERALCFTPLEAAFLARVSREADVFSDNQFSFKSSWFKEKELRPFVDKIIAKLEDKSLDEQVLMGLINEEEGPVRDALSSQFGALFMQDDKGGRAEDKARIMRRQILLLRSEYYSRLSRYFSRLLDSGLDEAKEKEVRRKYKAVLQARAACEKTLRDTDAVYGLEEDSRDYG